MICYFQNRRLHWSDSRPIGFARWNEIYYKRQGLFSVQLATRNSSLYDHGLQHLLSAVNQQLQPQHATGKQCTALLDSPGPSNMEFVSVPCDLALEVSGIMCISGGMKTPSTKDLFYSLHHWQGLTKQSSRLFFPASSIGRRVHFNLLRYKGKVDVETGVIDFPGLTPDENKYLQQHYETEKIWPWKERAISCQSKPSSRSRNRRLVDTMCNTTKLFTALHHLSKRVLIYTPGDITDNQSIVFGGHTLSAVQQCPTTWTLIINECVKPVTVPVGATEWDAICKRYDSRSRVLREVIILDNGTIKLEQWLLKWGLQRVGFVHDGHLVFVDATSPAINSYPDLSPNHVLCRMPPEPTKCPPGYYTCSNGECTPDIYLCDGYLNCLTGDDERNCNSTCFAPFLVDSQFCGSNCHPQNCSCNELLFQCPSGGCLHSSLLCDKVVDCVDGADENVCTPGLRYSGNMSVLQSEERNLFDDFFPDLEDESDELLYSKLLRATWTVDINLCQEDEIPCLPGHRACYPIDKACLYDKDEDGHLNYCRNGLHLRNCDLFDCSASFKCRSSYCIPAHRVCDRVIDCPYADDEEHCPIASCSSMLHCSSGRCVHPEQICDGISQCENGDDEKVCDAPSCPEGCTCLGYSVSCKFRNLTSVQVGLHYTTILILNSNEISLKHSTFTGYKQLLYLDLSSNKLRVSNFRLGKSPCALQGLIKLDISYNSFSNLAENLFSCLVSLQQLLISWNEQLTELSSKAFTGLTNLQMLFLDHTSLVIIQLSMFSHFEDLAVLNVSCATINIFQLSTCPRKPSIGIIDLTNNMLEIIESGSVDCLNNVSQILSDQDGLCCLKTLAEKCIHTHGYQDACLNLLVWKGTYLWISCLFIAVAIGNGVVGVYALSNKSNRESLLILNIAVVNLFSLQPMGSLVFWDQRYGHEVSFFHRSVAESLQCKIASSLMVVYMQVSNSSLVFLVLTKFMGVIQKYSPKAVTPRTTALKISLVWCLWGLPALVEAIWMPLVNAQSCLLGPAYAMWYTNFRLFCGVFNICCCISVTALYGRIARLSSEAKNRKLGTGHDTSRVSLYHSVIIRSAYTMVVTLLCLIPINVLMIVLVLDISSVNSVRSYSVAFMSLNQLQALTSPFLYTFLTRRFRTQVSSCLRVIYNK